MLVTSTGDAGGAGHEPALALRGARPTAACLVLLHGRPPAAAACFACVQAAGWTWPAPPRLQQVYASISKSTCWPPCTSIASGCERSWDILLLAAHLDWRGRGWVVRPQLCCCPVSAYVLPDTPAPTQLLGQRLLGRLPACARAPTAPVATGLRLGAALRISTATTTSTAACRQCQQAGRQGGRKGLSDDAIALGQTASLAAPGVGPIQSPAAT